MLSQLIVSESHEAVFLKDGKALDLFSAGKYTLHTQNIPLIRIYVKPYTAIIYAEFYDYLKAQHEMLG